MAPGPGSGPNNAWTTLNLNNLQPPRNPNKAFEAIAQAELQKRVEAIQLKISAELKTDTKLRDEVMALHKALNNQSHPWNDRLNYVNEEVAKIAASFIAKTKEGPLFSNYPKELTGTTFPNPALIEAHMEGVLKNDLTRAVSGAIDKAVRVGDDQYEKILRGILTKPTPLTQDDFNKWITTAGNELSSEEQKRLAATGLIQGLKGANGATAPRDINFFRNLRNGSLGCWAMTTGLCAAAIGGAVIGAVAAGPTALFAAGVCATNWVAQTILKRSFDRGFKATWAEATQEYASPDPKRATAWLGIMAKLVQECSPLVFGKNATEWFFGEKEESMRVSAVIDHLRLAAMSATESTVDKGENNRDFRDITGYQQKVKLAEPGLEALKQRWHGYWKQSEGVLVASSTVAGGAAFLLF
jgi:hypothetical protein